MKLGFFEFKGIFKFYTEKCNWKSKYPVRNWFSYLKFFIVLEFIPSNSVVFSIKLAEFEFIKVNTERCKISLIKTSLK